MHMKSSLHYIISIYQSVALFIHMHDFWPPLYITRLIIEYPREWLAQGTPPTTTSGHGPVMKIMCYPLFSRGN